MKNNNLTNILDFMKKNNDFSDYNFINNFIYNLNFTKYKFHKLQIGGYPNTPDTDADKMTETDKIIEQDDDVEIQQDDDTGEIQEDDEKIIQKDDGYESDVREINDCVYKQKQNLNGTITTEKICTKKIMTMPDIFLPKPQFMESGENTYTIKKGTILYHSTDSKRGFNTKEIRLGKDNLISFFTPNFRLASDKIQGCSIDKQKGFIHVFEVKTDIPNIYVKLPYDTDDDIDLDELKNTFCNGQNYYKGVGFFYPKNEIEMFNNAIQQTQEIQETEDTQDSFLDDENYYSEFALCLPGDYLEYLYSQKCMSLRKLSQPYRFDGKNFN